MLRPKYSIITINYNNADGLLKTVESVIRQTFLSVEYIVIDGNSGDGSKGILEKYSDKIAYWVSEPDKGIYHAMNKGTKRATGEYVLYLNSGDYLATDTVLEEIADEMKDADIIYGDMYREKNGTKTLSRYGGELTFEFFTRHCIPHQATFIKWERLQKNTGPYDETMKICADWKFLMDEICKWNATTRYLPVPISVFDENGISSDTANLSIVEKERSDVLNKEYKMFFKDTLELVQLRHEIRSRPIQLFLKLKKIVGKK